MVLQPLWIAKHGADVPAAVARHFAALGEPAGATQQKKQKNSARKVKV